MGAVWSVVRCILAGLLGALGMLGTILLGIPWAVLILLIWILEVLKWARENGCK